MAGLQRVLPLRCCASMAALCPKQPRASEAFAAEGTKIIAGVGTKHVIKKERLRCHQGLGVSCVDRFYSWVTR